MVIQEVIQKVWHDSVPAYDEQFDSIYQYFIKLLATNKKVNLFSRKLEPAEVFCDQLVDCALGIPHFPQTGSILDFGTGGGLPGVILAVCLPQTQVVLADKSDKKMHYLQKIITDLSVDNVSICPVEQLSERQFDVVTCRAVAPAARLIPLLERLLGTPPKRLLLYKARKETIDQELADFEGAPYDSLIEALPYPKGVKERHMVTLTRREETAE